MEHSFPSDLVVHSLQEIAGNATSKQTSSAGPSVTELPPRKESEQPEERSSSGDHELLSVLSSIPATRAEKEKMLQVFQTHESRLTELVLAVLFEESCAARGSQRLDQGDFNALKVRASELVAPIAEGNVSSIQHMLPRLHTELSRQLHANAMLELGFG